MKYREKDTELLKEILREELHLSNKAGFYFEIPVSNDFPVRADIVIEDRKKRILIELCRTASWDKLSHLLLVRDLDQRSDEVIMAGKLIPDSIKRAAEKLNVGILHLPEDIFIIKENLRPRGKLTSEKAWKIILHLLEEGPCSIRSISKSKNISYGWTHGVITNLISREIVDRKGNLVEISDPGVLFNAIAWERPLKDLEELEITTSFDSTHDLARTLTDWSEKRESPAVMCAYIASTLHFGIGVKGDMVQCYIHDSKTMETLKREFSSDLKNGIKLKVFKPDRNVLDESLIVDRIRITSKIQTVLDVAGLGYSGRDLLIEMVRSYGANSP